MKLEIVCSQFNAAICDRLIDGAKRACNHFELPTSAWRLHRVPGAWELISACEQLSKQTPQPDAIVALGALVRGETPHFDILAHGVAHGLSKITIDRSICIIFGVLTTDDMDQAVARTKQDETNKGFEAVQAAMDMIQFRNHTQKG